MSNSYICNLDILTNTKITIFLYRNVRNVSDIKRKLFAGEIQCAVLNPSLICSPFLIATAANKAMISKFRNTLTTRTIYTEVLYNLSPTRNISESLMKFGIDDELKNMIIIFLNNVENDDDFNKVLNIVDGEQVPINKLHEFNDISLIRKVYKISEAELKVSSLEDSILSKLSIKGFS